MLVSKPNKTRRYALRYYHLGASVSASEEVKRAFGALLTPEKRADGLQQRSKDQRTPHM